MQIAVFEKRLMAYIVDYSIAFAISLGIVISYSLSFPAGFLEFVDITLVLSAAVYFVLSFIGYMLFNGTTIGKLIFRIRVVNKKDYTRISIGTSFFRAAMQSVIVIAILNVIYQLIYRSSESIFDDSTNTICVNRHLFNV